MALGAKTQQIIEILSKALEAAFATIAALTSKDKDDEVALKAAKDHIAELEAQMADVDSSLAESLSGVFGKANEVIDLVSKLDPVGEPDPTPLPPVPPLENPPVEPPVESEPPIDGSTPESEPSTDPTQPLPPIILPEPAPEIPEAPPLPGESDQPPSIK